MNILQVPFKVLSIYGVWEPENLETSVARRLYRIYTTITSITLHLLLISITLALFRTSNLAELNEALSTDFTLFVVCCRIICLLLLRNRIIHLCYNIICYKMNFVQRKMIKNFK